MFVLIWTALLFSADAGESLEETTHCDNNFCITLSKGEIKAEAGLCVAIPCSFNTSDGFTSQHMVWYKCAPSRGRCGDSDVIFHTSNNNKVQPEFLGRVSLLEPDVNQKNCSIIINDLTESDSGKYQLRVNGFTDRKDEGFTFSQTATVSVKGLTQKPSVLVPPLIEGQQTTLTCTAPGLCSGSDPEITWTWRGAGEKDSHLPGNITDVPQRRRSTLTFNPSAEHHGTKVTCKVSFTNNMTTEETETLNVSCEYIRYCTLFSTFIFHVTAEYSGQYICTAEHQITNVTTPALVQLGVLTCVCISEGFPLPTISWPLLETHTEYSVTTNKSSHTVISITVSVKNHNYTTFECVSKNDLGEAKENITVGIMKSKQDVNSTIIPPVKDHSNSAVQCVSSGKVGNVQLNVTIITSERREVYRSHSSQRAYSFKSFTNYTMSFVITDQHGSSAALPWVIVAVVSLIVNVILLMFLMFFWNTRKKVKPNQEDRTYTSLRKMDSSPEYDVIAQPLN
ncbi:sialic acid-binding Ig-like lectin 10 [Clinocottus analis]|uniref:sialic acid-binding Ig-like lectin 10 n=1 Tax=Clinocottus analis TaxID=304258 RepID=UPI0035C192A9